VPEPPPGQEFVGRYRVCTPDYFQTMGIAVLQGRGFTEYDKAGATPVVIVNETSRRSTGPTRIRSARGCDSAVRSKGIPGLQIVGVVKDVSMSLNLPVTEDYYCRMLRIRGTRCAGGQNQSSTR